jgi:hypothetical protein
VSVLLSILERALRDIRGAVCDLEPERLSSTDAATLFSVFSALERAAVAGKTLTAARAADSRVWRDQGHRSAAAWVAQTTGTALGEAIGVLETAERLQSLPDTAGALRRGELSAPQVREIASTATANPAAEGELLEMAGRNSLKGLKDHCRRVRASSASERDARARYEEIRRSRFLLTWIDPDGAGRIEAKLTPDAMARFNAGINSETNAIYEEARKAGNHEPPVAYAADALVALVSGTNLRGNNSAPGHGGSRPTTMVHLRVDVAALRRGSLEDGETCEIPGVGPVPLATAVSELGDAIVKVIITDGVDVASICHLGRTVPAHIRSALEERDPMCVVPGCDVSKGLDIDHYVVPYIKDGPTELWNLCRLCRWHHYLKTHCGYGVVGGPGSWEWHAPTPIDDPGTGGRDPTGPTLIS